MTTPTDPTTLRTALEALYVAYDGLRAIAAFAPTRGIDSVVAEARRLADAIEPALATPAPAADEARCAVCGHEAHDGSLGCTFESPLEPDWFCACQHATTPAPTPAPLTPPATEPVAALVEHYQHTVRVVLMPDGAASLWCRSCDQYLDTPPAARSAGSGSRVEREYDEAVESVHRAFCFPDHEQVGEWDRSMADALRRRGYAIVNLNAADCPTPPPAGATQVPLPATDSTPPPAVDGTRCAECGGVKDDVFHVPCLVGGPFHYVKTCHPFTPPAPEPSAALVEELLRRIEESGHCRWCYVVTRADLDIIVAAAYREHPDDR